MNKLEIELGNCYGIGKFEHVFDFTNSNSFLIYAPNGTMKSSLARTFNDIAKNDKKFSPCDRIFQSRKSSCKILVDGSPINPESILVVDAENNSFDASGKISNFIASKELKNRYDKIYSELDSHKSEFIKKLKLISQSTDCESEFLNTYNTAYNSFFESVDSIIHLLEDSFKKYNFRYNDIFDKKGNVKKFLDKNQSLLDKYIKNYQDLLSNSKFFKRSENSFGTFQANEILKSIEDNSFFEAGHKIVLDGDISIDSADKLKKLVDEEITKIINDTKLKEAFDKVDKSIGANVELRSFKKVIESDNLLLLELNQYDDFKKKVWLSYMFELKSDAIDLAKFYKSKKKDLEAILKEAKKEFEIWKSIVSKFNSRFYVPFKVLLTNQEDVILKQETANLEFQYIDKKEEPIKQNKESLLEVLSKGEQRAYYILQLLFDIEARKANTNNIVIFDDIADSFDYKNKYAIIEYIKDLNNLDNFKIIILTHNFDFYRTLSSRLNLGNTVYMALKSDDRVIKLNRGEYRKDVFKYFVSNLEKPKIFISLIAFVRNLIDYSENDSCEEYIKLTSCLHMKSDSSKITANEIHNIYNNRLSSCSSKSIEFSNKGMIDLIFETANSISTESPVNEILLENKIVLSIASRLKAEQFMIKKLPHVDTSSITSNQTRVLFDEFSKIKAGDELQILDKVNLMTPENIHLNAFMYEPLIDMSLNHLMSLFSEISKLN